MSDGAVLTCMGGTIYQGGAWYDGVQDQEMAVFKSTDIAGSWSRYRLDSRGGQVRTIAVSPIDSNVLLAGGRLSIRSDYPPSACVFQSSDGGAHWSGPIISSFRTMESQINGIAFDPAMPTRVLAASGVPYYLSYNSESLGVHISTDAGLTWSPPAHQMNATCILADPNPTGLFFAGSDEGVWMSSDHGSSWQQINNGLPTRRILSLAYDPVNKFLYAGTRSGGAYRLDVEAALSVEPPQHGLPPQSFALFQNYPNPFNPKTGVRFQLSGVSDVNITVYDVLGAVVGVLVNERKQPGRYEVTFDGSALASGLYFCRMTAGSFVQSRKMLLLR